MRCKRATGICGAAIVLCALVAPAVAALAQFGIEGFAVVSTPAAEQRASIRPDGQRIVWAVRDRAGGAGGWDLWQASLDGIRWRDAAPLSIDTASDERDPAFSADGHWLYFASDRAGGVGGSDLYRSAVAADGSIGAPLNLGPGVNTPGDETSPTPNTDGTVLMFSARAHAGDARGTGNAGHARHGRHADLYQARWNGKQFAAPRPVPGLASTDDELDAAWLADGRGIVFARAPAGEPGTPGQAAMLLIAHCKAGSYVDVQPLVLAFNTGDSATRSPVVDASKPRELLISGSARAPRAGASDIYRMVTPATYGEPGCL